MWIQSLDQEDPLESKMASCSSFLSWQISWTQKPVGLQSMGLQRVRQYLATEHTYYIISYLKFTGLKQQFFCLQSVNELLELISTVLNDPIAITHHA